MKFPSLSQQRVLAIAALLASFLPRALRAEESIRYKYQDYNEAGGRVDVQVHSAAIEKDLGTATHLKVEGVIDAIAGATPNGQPAPAGSTQVPLFTEAINVQVVTRSPNESAEILDAALARLEGRSSWLSSAERSRALGEALGKIAAVILGITGAAAWVFRRKKPKA